MVPAYQQGDTKTIEACTILTKIVTCDIVFVVCLIFQNL